MSDDDDTEKQHDPSQKKLDDARKKGELPRSQDLNTAAAYAGMLLAAVGFGIVSLEGFGTAMMSLLDRSDSLSTRIFEGSGTVVSGGMIARVLGTLAPWFVAPAVAVILMIIAQKSFVVAPSKLSPKFSRISPMANAKNKFGRSGFFEFFKSFSKLLLFSIILGVFLTTQLSRILATLHLPPNMIASELGALTVQFLFIVLMVSTCLGSLDYFWQRAEHIRKNRMSRKEVMDENKNSEGDPMMKQQRRQRGFEIAMNQMLADVAEADVIIVNPTHYAIALKWNRASGGAPHCVAKGVDQIALRIRERAAETGVPIHSDPPTARALFAGVEIGDEISPDHYRVVAAAIRFAERMRKSAAKNGFL